MDEPTADSWSAGREAFSKSITGRPVPWLLRCVLMPGLGLLVGCPADSTTMTKPECHHHWPLATEGPGLVWQCRQGLGHRQHCETTELICVVIDITGFMCELGHINGTISRSWHQRRRTPTVEKSRKDLTSKPSRGCLT